MRRSNFPYVVEIPMSGRGTLAMRDFHARLGITEHRVHERYMKNGGRYTRWRFASLTDAEKFARQFGGSLVAGQRSNRQD
jgi:hypothetical protein